MKIVLTKIQDYKDDNNNVISCGVVIESGFKVEFTGKNNKLVIHPEAKNRNLTIMFDCDDGYCEIGKNTFSGVVRVGFESTIKIGSGINCTSPVYISAAEKASVHLGDDIMFASQVEIRADDGHPIFDVRTRKRINLPKNVMIGNHVWLGAYTRILGGTTIGDGSVVGIGSIVKGKFPNNCIIVGVPGKVVRKDIAWERPHLTLTKPYYKDDPGSIALTDYWNLTVEDTPTVESLDYTSPVHKYSRLTSFLKLLKFW
ncbi:acyltransferase [Pseudomonas sp. P8_241]|uniref:acyltransferase n=1 Tax=Pseudomonas sp. P8_241 TaxID=3043445 RepID=UPI002A36397D|nr:acyltransferase [Pseudomonas sp. P8_241]WPN45920.1 acyltransferase [Pseudomonas sp. P8_241]